MQLVTIQEIEQATEEIYKTKFVNKTPLLSIDSRIVAQFNGGNFNLSFKLESLQTQGSFKTRYNFFVTIKNFRGIIYQINELRKCHEQEELQLVSMSGGNYARSFSYIAGLLQIPVTVVMPSSVPQDRVEACQSFGATVVQAPTVLLQAKVNEYVAKGYIFTHPFDDVHLIRAYGSIGMEILEQTQHVDIILCGIGGGGLISGVATYIKSKRPTVRIYGVEPENSPSMSLSIKQGTAVTLQAQQPTICSGLAPPYAGTVTLEHVKQYVDDIVLVSDDNVRQALFILVNRLKLIVEPSGAACFAALLANKIPDTQNKQICCILSGGNVTLMDLNKYLQ